MVNEHFGVWPTFSYHSRNYVLRKCQVSGFTKKHQAPKLPATWQVKDVLHSPIPLNVLIALIPSHCHP